MRTPGTDSASGPGRPQGRLPGVSSAGEVEAAVAHESVVASGLVERIGARSPQGGRAFRRSPTRRSASCLLPSRPSRAVSLLGIGTSPLEQNSLLAWFSGTRGEPAMPVVHSGLRARQKAVPHRCAERPFANSTVPSGLAQLAGSPSHILVRMNTLSHEPYDNQIYFNAAAVSPGSATASTSAPCSTPASSRSGWTTASGALPLSTLWRRFGRLREARAVGH